MKFFDFRRTEANYMLRLGELSRAIKLRSKYRVHLLKIILFQKSLPPGTEYHFGWTEIQHPFAFFTVVVPSEFFLFSEENTRIQYSVLGAILTSLTTLSFF